MNICVYGAASNKIADKYIDAGERLGEAIAERGHSLIFGGGSAGMMGAAARGVHRTGGNIIGILPKFLAVDGIPFEHCTEKIFTEDMRSRKKLLEDKSDGFIITPGGLGTLDEFFEILTLKQLGRHNKPVAVLNTDGFYDDIMKMLRRIVNEQFMFEASMKLFGVFEQPQQALEYVENYQDNTANVAEMKSIGVDFQHK